MINHNYDFIELSDNDSYINAPDHVTAQNLKDIQNACGRPILYN